MIEQALGMCGLSLSVRGEALTLAQFAQLANAFTEISWFKPRLVHFQNQGVANFATPFFLPLRKQCVNKLFGLTVFYT